MPDINKPVTNPELITAIHEMYTLNNRFTQSNMLEEVANAKFLLPVIMGVSQQPDENGMITLDDDSDINFPLIENNDGKVFFLAFTDWGELQKWKKTADQQTLVVGFDDYVALVFQKGSVVEGFAINPYGESVMFTRSMIKSLADQLDLKKKGIIQLVSEDGSKALLGEPKIFPFDIANAICDYAFSDESINALYLQMMTRGDNRRYIIVVDYTEDADKESILAGISAVAEPLITDVAIDLIELDSEFGKTAAGNTKPFYTKDN